MSSGLGLQPHETLIQKYLSLRLKDSSQGEGALQERPLASLGWNEADAGTR
jgi:hypothetical protein